MAGLEDLSPEELKQYRLGKLLLETNPDIALEAKRLARKANPQLRLPEVDLDDKLAAEKKAREEWEEKQETQAREDRVNRRRQEEARKAEAAGFTQEEIEKIVVDEKCSFATAIKLATLQRESALPGPASFNSSDPLARTKDGEYDWRKHSSPDNRRKGLEIAHQGIEDMLRRQRAGR